MKYSKWVAGIPSFHTEDNQKWIPNGIFINDIVGHSMQHTNHY